MKKFLLLALLAKIDGLKTISIFILIKMHKKDEYLDQQDTVKIRISEYLQEFHNSGQQTTSNQEKSPFITPPINTRMS